MKSGPPSAAISVALYDFFEGERRHATRAEGFYSARRGNEASGMAQGNQVI